MQLIRFGNKGEEKPGIVINNQRKDCSQFFEDWNHSFFQNDGLNKLADVIKNNIAELPDVDENIRLGSPIARPGMIVCVGLNYADHAKEAGMEIPTEPVIFMKAANTISGPFDPVQIPQKSNKTDWEVELGIVIKKDASYLKDEKEAEDHIAGYCVVHDISEREFQLEKGGQWVKGKSCPGFSPVGPNLVTKDEISNVEALKMQLSVNGQMMQNGNTKTMVFKPAYIVWYLSQYMLLEAGDLISTGTPPGIGGAMKPPVFLKEKDVVELSIEGLGKQKQTFV